MDDVPNPKPQIGVSWLHISDFHLKEGDGYDRDKVLQSLLASVTAFREKENRAPDLIFATGDIAFSGQAGEYKLATGFFDKLLVATGLDKSRLCVIPGNHDHTTKFN